MAGQDLVRPSRDGDQFHYHWAARQCLALLPGTNDLVAVTVEGASVDEAEKDSIEAGEQLIDVGLYYGTENRDSAKLVRYVQLKHSTRRSLEAWTASGLEKTIKGFAERYAKLLERYSADDTAQRFRFEFTTNRPIEQKLSETLADLASGAVARHPKLQQALIDFTGLGGVKAIEFLRLFFAEGGEEALWAQRNLLAREIGDYLPDLDYDAPVQLKELVTRKATTEFESNPSIRRHDVLRALKTDQGQLQPAPCLISDATGFLPRAQEQEILRALLASEGPVVIHADGGVGKSVLAARLTGSMPAGSEAVLYDCFGDGLYRNALHFRHRHRDAFVQIANELAARGLCHPLIPTVHADTKQYMRAFLHRLAQAVGVVRAGNPNAHLCLIIDAADNAEMAAEEQKEAASFVRDLIRVPLPEGAHLAFTCRTHRRWRLGAPLDAQEIELRPFDESESASHLRGSYPLASDGDVAEFAFLSSSNPRVQALAISRGLSLPQMLKQLGPTPTTVDRAIGELLEAAVARLRDQVGVVEASQIDVICQGLAVLRPLVPISLLAQLSQTSESAVRSFALDLGRPLLVKGNSLHFLDEPAETWFRERFQPDAAGLARFLERLRPLSTGSSYAAAALPQLLLQAGKLDELVDLALSGEGLPTENPLERRDVEMQRLTFALKACLHQKRHMAAAKLALKAGGECAGEQRQNKLIQENTDVAAVLMAPDRIEEIVSRRIFGSGWMGSHHAYDAGLLSGREEFAAEASSGLRMAMDWLHTWARLPEDERRQEQVGETDRAELAMALLRLRGPLVAARFLRGWTWRRHAFDAGRHLARRLVDLGQYEQLDELAEAAGNDIWLLLGLAVEARTVAHSLRAAPLARLLRLLADRRVKLSESDQWGANRSLLHSICSAIELALYALPPEQEAWATILQRYLPSVPPPELTSRYASDRTPLLRAYALEAALRGQQLKLLDIAPPDVRKQLETDNQYGRSEETNVFLQEVGGRLAWFALSAEIACGRPPEDLAEAIGSAMKETSSAQTRIYRQDYSLLQTAALEWLRVIRDAGTSKVPELEKFRSWLVSLKDPLWPDTLISLCRSAARAEGLLPLALDLAVGAYRSLEGSREDAESRADSYLKLARAVLAVSPSEAGVYFNRAVEIASRIGDENLDRWSAFLRLAEAAGERDNPRPRTAYRLSRFAELTYEYVARDKYFDWHSTAEALVDLCASSALAILSRWRDRRFGDPGRLLPLMIYRLTEQGRLSAIAPLAFAGVEAEWDRLADLKRFVSGPADFALRTKVADIAYRYMRVLPCEAESWADLGELSKGFSLEFPDIHRLIAAQREHVSVGKKGISEPNFSTIEQERRSPDWHTIFQGIDFADADALRSAYSAFRTYDPPHDFETFFREALERVRVGREAEFVRATAAWPDFGIFELRSLLNALSSPPPKQLSLRSAIRDAVLSACRREPQRVRARGWSSLIPFEKLHAEGLVSNTDVVRATLEGFSAQVDALGASELFQLVDPLAACVSPEEADEALNFGLDLLEDVLRPDDGDGDWRPELLPPHSLISALGGYVWAGLGSPRASERWQYAHVVRSVVEAGWTELLEALIAWERGGAGAFVDQRLQFYTWHARQWLLIGLARGGLENAVALRPAAPLLELCFREEHVLIRALAAQALRALVSAGELKAEEVGDLDSVNRPSLPEVVYTRWLAPVEDADSSTEEELHDDEKYYFGIDIGPYWFRPLGSVFGLTEDAIERRAHDVLRQQLGNGDAEWRVDARHKLKIFRDSETHHSHGSQPQTDDLRAYHAYHAMMLVAAGLLKEKPVRRHAEEAMDQFGDWLSRYMLTRSDGGWLADRRDPRLVADPAPPESYNDESWRWNVTPNYLDQKLISDDGLTVFWGHWDGGDTDHAETVSVRSALVARGGAEALLAALQTSPDPGRFVLPDASPEDRDDLDAGPLKLVGWVTDDSLPARLDEEDPWGEHLHFPGPSPSVDAIARLGLAVSIDGRSWTTGSDGLLRGETWTQTNGYGRETETSSGWRLSGDRQFLQSLLAGYPDNQLVLSVTIRRRPPRHARNEDMFESYPWPYVRYYLMGADGVAHTL